MPVGEPTRTWDHHRAADRGLNTPRINFNLDATAFDVGAAQVIGCRDAPNPG